MKIDLEVQKEVAKIGMTATLGATVVTSMFMKNSVAKKVHVVAGVAFCGFALWHHTLYQSKKPKKIKKSQDLQETQEQEELKVQLN
ncbi:hypothetical protein AVENP_0583 [Arcobacter venerupis]|uniref:Helicase n=1 Tax=Arcobacter venerupis TaxID=1054033 RepID=A0AAE7E3N3_9BACT|nr:hypothetical protein [Arcobacter venerupis]QKF66157.1 hypothetical protein AVENP_0583 [Arcobacter venerupis]RWS51055.1 hypothetical protein CKA56_01630 [Arcobacter venerupis]